MNTQIPLKMLTQLIKIQSVLPHSFLSRQILDVRSLTEYKRNMIPGAIHIPVDELIHRHHELCQEMPYTVVCAHGVRSITATEYLQTKGFDAISLPGGMATLRLKQTSIEF